jgi:hypothetical protein
MNLNTKNKLTTPKRFFLEPSNSAQRQYEALRAFFVEQIPSVEAAKRFGYTPGSFRVLVHHFRHNPDQQFFLSPQRGPDSSPKSDPLRERIIALRKQNFSIYDIRDLLRQEDHSLSTSAISAILKEEGFSKLPRRGDDERIETPRPDPADAARVQLRDLKPRVFRTKFGGLFLFLPLLAKIPLDDILQKADFPGSSKIPAAYAMRSLLALKLFGNSRHSHVMSYVFDEGFAAIDVIQEVDMPFAADGRFSKIVAAYRADNHYPPVRMRDHVRIAKLLPTVFALAVQPAQVVAAD